MNGQIEDRGIAAWSAKKAAEARRNRNLDRAIVIVARLMFEGCILMDVNFIDGDKFQNAVKAVLDSLEGFQLDSPEREIIDIFDRRTGKTDTPGV